MFGKTEDGEEVDAEIPPELYSNFMQFVNESLSQKKQNLKISEFQSYFENQATAAATAVGSTSLNLSGANNNIKNQSSDVMTPLAFAQLQQRNREQFLKYNRSLIEAPDANRNPLMRYEPPPLLSM